MKFFATMIVVSLMSVSTVHAKSSVITLIDAGKILFEGKSSGTVFQILAKESGEVKMLTAKNWRSELQRNPTLYKDAITALKNKNFKFETPELLKAEAFSKEALGKHFRNSDKNGGSIASSEKQNAFQKAKDKLNGNQEEVVAIDDIVATENKVTVKKNKTSNEEVVLNKKPSKSKSSVKDEVVVKDEKVIKDNAGKAAEGREVPFEPVAKNETAPSTYESRQKIDADVESEFAHLNNPDPVAPELRDGLVNSDAVLDQYSLIELKDGSKPNLNLVSDRTCGIKNQTLDNEATKNTLKLSRRTVNEVQILEAKMTAAGKSRADIAACIQASLAQIIIEQAMEVFKVGRASAIKKLETIAEHCNIAEQLLNRYRKAGNQKNLRNIGLKCAA